MYAGDLLAVVYMLYFLRKFYYAVGIPIVSFFSYALCTSLNETLIHYLGVPMTIFYLLVIIGLIRDFVLSGKTSEK